MSQRRPLGYGLEKELLLLEKYLPYKLRMLLEGQHMLAPAESKPNHAMIEAVLLSEAPKQWEHFQNNKMKRSRGKVRWQRELERRWT